VLDQILAKTDGVPLFMEELTKSVLESDLLREENGVYVLARFADRTPRSAVADQGKSSRSVQRSAANFPTRCSRPSPDQGRGLKQRFAPVDGSRVDLSSRWPG